MKLPNIKKLVITGATLVTVLSVVTVAVAQELQRTYTVVNPSITEKLNPGDKREGTTKVINDSNVPLTFNIGVQDYTVVGTNGTPNLLPPNTQNAKYSASAWIGVSPSTFTLKPREKQIVNYFIQVPRDAKPGGHYAALVYQPVTPNQPSQTGGIVTTQIGSLFYLTVNGPINENSVVTNFFANNFQEYGPVKILTEIKNMGDLHISPEGTVTVSGLFGKSSYTFPKGNIFPETTRQFENLVGHTLMIGRYKAELLASYGVNNNLPLTATVYFWVFPWRLIIIIVLIIIATILGYKYYQKRKKDGPKGTKEAKTEAVEKHTEHTAKAEESPKKVG